MFLLSWIRDIFAFFGFKRNAKLLIIGLDNAGKSTFLDRVADGRLVQNPPTLQTRCKQLDLGRLRFTAYDLGGHPHVRRIWRDYFPAVDGILFVVDAADEARFEEAKAELDSVLTCDITPDVPVAILMNKIDRKEAVSEESLVQAFNLYPTKTGKEHVPREKLGRRSVETFPTSLVKRLGYGEALRWLAYYIE
ncbi:uncharacterized protein LOC127866193 [Dreissena polymorpha]|uniref:small monomeric GTPase n=1 Tax=Dreissena polymorpha TaxID=45954 RepID=A0A9D4LQY2_DREPO|nr:uncharacterized protein LOC127866193 [Dreissena polymorpha]KAH3862249.1 hypothetical protein DPMN_025215 [Dreissena polymorpha]